MSAIAKFDLIVFSILTSLLLVCACGCNDKNEPSTNALDSVDYVVISSALEEFFFRQSDTLYIVTDSMTYKDVLTKRDDIKMLIVVDSTVQYLDSIRPYVHRRHSEIDSTDKDLTEKLVKVNRQRVSIDNSKITSFETSILTYDEEEKMFERSCEQGYEMLYEKYSEAYGFIRLSRPAFNEKGDKAIIYIGLHRDFLNGEGAYIWLKKIKNEWIAYDIMLLWVS